MLVKIDFTKFSDEEQDRYVEAWADAGGIMNDGESGSPWCAPWYWGFSVQKLDLPEGYTIEDIAVAMCQKYRADMDKIIAEEAEFKKRQEEQEEEDRQMRAQELISWLEKSADPEDRAEAALLRKEEEERLASLKEEEETED